MSNIFLHSPQRIEKKEEIGFAARRGYGTLRLLTISL
jgi:hypothetical protein